MMVMVLTRLRKCSALEIVSRLISLIPLDEHQVRASAQATLFIIIIGGIVDHCYDQYTCTPWRQPTKYERPPQVCNNPGMTITMIGADDGNDNHNDGDNYHYNVELWNCG